MRAKIGHITEAGTTAYTCLDRADFSNLIPFVNDVFAAECGAHPDQIDIRDCEFGGHDVIVVHGKVRATLQLCSDQTEAQRRIKTSCAIEVDPRLIEAWLRCEYGTLDALGKTDFINSVYAAQACVMADRAMAERLAQSYGL